jgi:hypothetical protein
MVRKNTDFHLVIGYLTTADMLQLLTWEETVLAKTRIEAKKFMIKKNNI